MLIFQVFVPFILWILHGDAVHIINDVNEDSTINETNEENISNAKHLEPIVSIDHNRLPRLDNSFYKFHVDPQIWNDARNICNSEGGYLVILNSYEESQYITALLNGLYPESSIQDQGVDKTIAYIGFHDLFKTGEYVTIDGLNIERSGFTHWSPGEPSGPGRENCGSIKRKDGLLNDIFCDTKAVYICEIPVHK
ncbi:hemolymph lipopolysaccharide-binding protein-like [Chrysoperla carnea]|uniref:hemolymph lipopolysaccharide-binding protein-like n=1 Tax=Chrysoperla carnea TaxID=189513 RepID=UPI001D073D46|nr:hemolymph lipopolysaccharide-binding protein-like [Chrysoperla carnea]